MGTKISLFLTEVKYTYIVIYGVCLCRTMKYSLGISRQAATFSTSFDPEILFLGIYLKEVKEKQRNNVYQIITSSNLLGIKELETNQLSIYWEMVEKTMLYKQNIFMK